MNAQQNHIAPATALWNFAQTINVESTPDSLLCKARGTPSHFKLNGFKLLCCDNILCEACHLQSESDDSCPFCGHKPYKADIAKANRRTAKAHLKTELQKHEAGKTVSDQDPEALTSLEVAAERLENIVAEPPLQATTKDMEIMAAIPPVTAQEAEVASTIQMTGTPTGDTDVAAAAVYTGEDNDEDDSSDDDIQFTFNEGIIRKETSRSPTPGSRRDEPVGDHAEDPIYQNEEGAKERGNEADILDSKATTTEDFAKGIDDVQGKGYMNHNDRSQNQWNMNQYGQGNGLTHVPFNGMNMFPQNAVQNSSMNQFDPNFWNMMQTMLSMQQNPMYNMQMMGNGMMPFNNSMQQNGFPGQFDGGRGRGKRGRGRDRDRGGYINSRNNSSAGNANFAPQMGNYLPNQFAGDNNHPQQDFQGRGGRFNMNRGARQGPWSGKNEVIQEQQETIAAPDDTDLAPGGQDEVAEALGEEYKIDTVKRESVAATPVPVDASDTRAGGDVDAAAQSALLAIDTSITKLASSRNTPDVKAETVPEAYNEDLEHVMAPPSAPLGPSARDVAFRARGGNKFHRSRGSFQGSAGSATPVSPARPMSQTQSDSPTTSAGVVGAPTGPRAMRDKESVIKPVIRQESDTGFKVMGRARELHSRDELESRHEREDREQSYRSKGDRARRTESSRDESRASKSDHKRRKSHRQEDLYDDDTNMDPEASYISKSNSRIDSPDHESSHRSRKERDRDRERKDSHRTSSGIKRKSSYRYEEEIITYDHHDTNSFDDNTSEPQLQSMSRTSKPSRKSRYHEDIISERDRDRDYDSSSRRGHEIDRSEKDKHRRRSRRDRDEDERMDEDDAYQNVSTRDHDDDEEEYSRRSSKKHKSRHDKHESSRRERDREREREREHDRDRDREREYDDTDLGMRISGRSRRDKEKDHNESAGGAGSSKNKVNANGAATSAGNIDPYQAEREAQQKKREMKHANRKAGIADSRDYGRDEGRSGGSRKSRR